MEVSSSGIVSTKSNGDDSDTSFETAQSEVALLVNLPCEIIEYICEFLSSVDVARLSQTCYKLWITINKDAVWKRFVVQQEDLRLEQQVEPFTSFEDLQVCPKRESFLREQRLLKNWKSGTFVEYRAETNHSYRSGVFHKLKCKGQSFYDERYIFIGRFVNDVHSDGIDVWDVAKAPVLHTTFKIADEDYDGFYLIGDFLVVVECVKVYVYSINLTEKTFPLEYSFVATENFVVLKERVEHEGRHDIRCVGWCHSSTSGGCLIMNKCGEPENVIHVWNILEGRKEGCFESPMQGFSLSLAAELENHWVLIQNMQTGGDMFYLFFDVERKEFSSYVCKFTFYSLKSVFLKNVLLVFKNAQPCNADGFHDTECCIYSIDIDSASTLHDLDTTPELVKRRFNTGKTYWIPSTGVVDSRFAIKCGVFVHLVNALTLETINKFPDNQDGQITDHFNVLGRLFVLSSRLLKYYGSSCSQSLDTVNEKGSKLIDTCIEDMFLSKRCTKLVITSYYKLYVIHFW